MNWNTDQLTCWRGCPARWWSTSSCWSRHWEGRPTCWTLTRHRGMSWRRAEMTSWRTLWWSLWRRHLWWVEDWCRWGLWGGKLAHLCKWVTGSWRRCSLKEGHTTWGTWPTHWHWRTTQQGCSSCSGSLAHKAVCFTVFIWKHSSSVKSLN